jgi:NAD(P)H-quinone oxidoreductase subunit 5
MHLFRIPDSGLFRADSLSWVMAGLILYVIANVAAYSRRYLAGDSNRRSHQRFVLLLGAAVLCLVFANHLLLFWAAWAVSNLLLVRLMIHNGRWIAARNSGLLALKTFGVGLILLGVGFWLLAANAGTATISAIVQTSGTTTTIGFAGLLLVAIAAMTQSAAWPFHGWLISSLNSPTPVSALMHAGLVNGGGFLLVRFAPLYATQPVLLHGLFVAGLITAVVGTFWKLLQTDIKRMLACSTMGQMGFMLMQVGMGLFAPAISHLCWHGLFKAYLFLNAGSGVQEKRTALTGGLSPVRVVIACLAGVSGALMFALTSGTDLNWGDTGFLMIAIAFMAAAQLAIGLLREPLTPFRLTATFLAGCGAGGLYGLSIRLVETALASLHAMPPQPMDAVYFTGFAVIFLVWVAMILDLPARLQSRPSWKRLYLAALNGSQPHSHTVTETRTTYQS